MNRYQIIILITLAVRYFLLFFEWRTVQRVRTELPDEISDVCTREQFSKSQEYTRVRTGFHLTESTFGLAVLLLFWFSGGFNKVDEIVRSWDFPFIITGILYIGILVIANALLALPFDIYSTFVIEERFEFNRTTPAIFVMDRIKGLALMALIGTPVVAAVLWFFERTGSNAWIYCWIFSAVAGLAIQFLAPVWILPLFNKFTPLPDGPLKTEIFALAEKLRFPLKEISVIDSSKRTSKTNAFFTGFGKNKRIALYDTLVGGNTIPEVVAVLAHEIGHYKRKHILQGTLIGLIHSGVVFFLLSLFLEKQGLFDAFYMDQKSIYAGLIFFGLLYGPISFLLSIAMNALSRKNEYEADRFAVFNISEKNDIISALKKLYATNLSNLTPHPLYVFLNYSHPPLVERIRAINAA